MNELTSKLLGYFGIFVIATVSMWQLWNWVMPELGLPQLSYLKFMGLTLLSYFIFPGGVASKVTSSN